MSQSQLCTLNVFHSIYFIPHSSPVIRDTRAIGVEKFLLRGEQISQLFHRQYYYLWRDTLQQCKKHGGPSTLGQGAFDTGDMSAIYMHNHWTKLVDWTSRLDWWTQLKSLFLPQPCWVTITTVSALSTDLEPSRWYLRLVSSTDPSYHALLEDWRGKKGRRIW